MDKQITAYLRGQKLPKKKHMKVNYLNKRLRQLSLSGKKRTVEEKPEYFPPFDCFKKPSLFKSVTCT